MDISIAVIGLGYVGLPLACKLSSDFQTVGFDSNTRKVSELKTGCDSNGQLSKYELENTRLVITDQEKCIDQSNVYIIAVPTPVCSDKTPDLTNVVTATRMVAKHLNKDDTIVYESTVYPGTTEGICKNVVLENTSLKAEDFHLGFSPERINPGDRIHNVSNTMKLVSADSKETLKILHYIYDKVTNGHAVNCESIKVAEASKILENVQRDVNIALMNEFSQIMEDEDIPFRQVLLAAGTKWNFKSFHPGMVGGHCIGVDPYYFIDGARKDGFSTPLISISRVINENVSKRIIEKITSFLQEKHLKRPNLLVLGVTFKPNCSDVRNSKPIEIVDEIQRAMPGSNISIFDPFVQKIGSNSSIPISELKYKIKQADVIMLLAPHKELVTELYSLLSFKKKESFIVDPYGTLNNEGKKDKYFSLV